MEIYKQILIFAMYFILSFGVTRVIYYYLPRKVILFFILPLLLLVTSITLLMLSLLLGTNQSELLRVTLFLFVATGGSLLANIMALNNKK